MIIELKKPQIAAPLFQGWNETLIWSCLEGTMGHIYVPAPDFSTDMTKGKGQLPFCAMAFIGDFCFLAGVPTMELTAFKPPGANEAYTLMVPQNEAWAAVIEKCFGRRARRICRYAIKKEPKAFDRQALTAIVNGFVKPGYTLRFIDEALFHHCRQLDWCRDFVAQYADYAMYEKYGLGVVILKNGEPVSGASSYSSYSKGIEIEIDTREDHRRQGLALVCGAKLILACLERGLYPSWDAHTRWSVRLAEKLGYHMDYAYPAYEIGWSLP